MEKELEDLAGRTVRMLRERGMTVTAVESCTGGMISKLLTDIPGASEVYRGGFITYSDETKHGFVGVRRETLIEYTAVSRETAQEMVLGGIKAAGADAGISVTGYAGPGKGERGEPAGLVYIGCAAGGEASVREYHFSGSRSQVREQAAKEALKFLGERLLGQDVERAGSSETIRIRYFTDQIEKLHYIGGKSDWIDLRAAEEMEIKKGEFRLIPLGVAMELPAGYEAQVIPRSSTFKNFGILQVNSMGLIDESYCGNDDQWFFPALAVRDTKIHVNDRICQFRITRHQPAIHFEETEKLSGNNRGGFGSTGKQ